MAEWGENRPSEGFYRIISVWFLIVRYTYNTFSLTLGSLQTASWSVPRQARDEWRFPWTCRMAWKMLSWKLSLWLKTRSRYIYLYSIAGHRVGRCGVQYTMPHRDIRVVELPGGESLQKMFPAFPASPAFCVDALVPIRTLGPGSPHDVWWRTWSLLVSSCDLLCTTQCLRTSLTANCCRGVVRTGKCRL